MSIHEDVPGVIGRMGTVLGNNKINIARMGLGREEKGGKALMLVSIDNPVDASVLREMGAGKEAREVRLIKLSHLANREYLQI